MPCNQTTYPHGTIPANRTYRFGETAESECSIFCKQQPGPVTLDSVATALAQCNDFINGREVPTLEGTEFNYVEENMVCEPCTAQPTFDELGYDWVVGIGYCCIDGQYVGPDGVSGLC